MRWRRIHAYKNVVLIPKTHEKEKIIMSDETAADFVIRDTYTVG